MKQAVDSGLAVSAKAYGRGVRALDELGFRRKGLARSLVVILALIVGLVLKIRQVDAAHGRKIPGRGGPSMTEHVLEPDENRRGFINWLLGTSAVAFVLSVVYPVASYLVPPTVGESTAGNRHAAHQARRREAQYGTDLQVRQPPGDSDPHHERRPPGLLGDLHPPELHGAVPAGSQPDLVRLPQRPLRPERQERRGPAAATTGRLRGQRARHTRSSSARAPDHGGGPSTRHGRLGVARRAHRADGSGEARPEEADPRPPAHASGTTWAA